MELQCLLRRALALLKQSGAHTFDSILVQFAHELANELHLPAFAFKVGNAFGFGHGFHQFFWQIHFGHQVGTQCQQAFAQLLKLVAFTL